MISFLVAVAPLSAQVRDRAPAPLSDTAQMARGWTALSQGRPGDAVSAANAVLARSPWHHQALGLKIEALVAGQGPVAALDAYESALPSMRNADDPGLLDPIARGVLGAIAKGTDAGLKILALERLARAGETSARAELSALAAQGPGADLALARLGDEAALKRLTAAAGNPGNHIAAAEALTASGASAIPALIAMLQNGDEVTRATAAAGLGRLHATEARQALTEAMAAPEPFLRNSATIALAQLGDPAAQQQVDQLLRSDVPGLQLMAARAYEGRPGPWVQVVERLLENPDSTVRLEAAKVIAPVNPAAAATAVASAAADPNVAVREEASRVGEELIDAGVVPASITEMRHMCRDENPAVRLHGAAAILALERRPPR